jgi:hypothetical protein
VGVAVGLLGWPPLRDRATWTSMAQLPQDLAPILTAMAAGVRPELLPSDAEAWVGDLRRLDERIDEAWRLLGQARESGRLNPRRSRPAGMDDLMRTLHLIELSTDSLAGSAWLEYGGLLVNLRNVVSALTQVTEWHKGSASSPRRSRRQLLRLCHRPAGYSPPDDDTTQRPTP